MQYFVNSYEMQQYDTNTMTHYKVPGIVLMERAALAFVNELHKNNYDVSQVLVVCGSGNNGGDGLAIARMLFLEGSAVTVVCVGNPNHCSEQNQIQQDIVRAYGMDIHTQIPDIHPTLVIDALFGVGLSREITGMYADIIQQMNRLQAKKAAVDIASGIFADTGAILGTAFCADMTVTFAFAKIGNILWPGNEYTGKLIVCDIGITKESWLGLMPSVMALEWSDTTLLPKRKSHSNKGSFGKLLVIAGSVNLAGAAIFCARAAYAAGCGLVRILTAKENRSILQCSIPEAILTTFEKENLDEKVILEALNWADAVVIGPGIGTDTTAEQLVDCVTAHAVSEKNVKMLFDADALNLIAKRKTRLLPGTVITPHLGEMARLTHKSVLELQKHLISEASEFAERYQVICVLKDEHTVTALPNQRTYLNLSGNHGMATAGSGDVLSGIIGALLAQNVLPQTAAPLGVYLHGAAGDRMVQKTGTAGLMASDLIDGIKEVLQETEKRWEAN